MGYFDQVDYNHWEGVVISFGAMGVDYIFTPFTSTGLKIKLYVFYTYMRK